MSSMIPMMFKLLFFLWNFYLIPLQWTPKGAMKFIAVRFHQRENDFFF